MQTNSANTQLIHYIILVIITLTILVIMAHLSIKYTADNKSIPVLQEQILVPNKAWGWNISGSGTLPRNMVNFCDTLPQSCQGAENFYFRSERLFDSYTLLLDLLDNSFVPQELLIEAKRMTQRPAYSPTSDNIAPLGWAKINDGAEIIRWTPTYSISTWPKQWLATITEGSNPQTIRFPIPTNTPLTLHFIASNSEYSSLPLAHRKNYLEISAKAWGRIKVTPGAWFNSSLLALIKEQKPSLKGGYNLDTFFGPQGLLNCRISELLVAYQPSTQLSASKDFVQSNDNQLTHGSQFRLGPVKFTNASKQKTTTNSDQSTYTLSSESEQAIIVAVNVAPI